MTRRLAAAGFVCVVMFAYAADAREGFGFTKKSVDMTRTIPPTLNVSGTRVKVTASSERSSNSDDAQALRRYTEEKLVAGSRFAAAATPDVSVALLMNRLDSNETWETKTEYESRPYTRQVYNNNRKRYETKTEYRSVPVQKQIKVVTGSISGRYTIANRKGSVLDSGDFDSAFVHKYPDGTGSPSPGRVEDDLVKKAAMRVAAKLVPTTDRVEVLLPKGSFENFIPLAEGGAWDRYLSSVESVPENRDRSSEAFRQFALAVAKEAVAYSTADQKRATDLLRESVRHYENAISYNPDEELFRERYDSVFSSKIDAALPRAKESLARYEAWRTAPVAVAETKSSPPSRGKRSTSAKTMRNETVMDMASAGLTDENIILAIDAAKSRQFDLSPEALIALARGGVSKAVIAHMQRKAR
jgi:hypothetical protein